MKSWTSIRAVYMLISILLLVAVTLNFWPLVIFLVVMLQLAAWTKFCPSKWILEKVGFKKSDL